MSYRKRFVSFLLVLLTGSSLALAAQQIIGQRPPGTSDWQHAPSWREAWVGHHGVKMRVYKPLGSHLADRRIQVLSMGPGAPGLVEQRQPAAANFTANGQTFTLAPTPQGTLEMILPGSTIRHGIANSAQLIVWDAHGLELAAFSFDQTYFF